MPKKIDNKTLSEKEHRMWKKTRAAARSRGAKSPEAVATAVVKKARKRKR